MSSSRTENVIRNTKTGIILRFVRMIANFVLKTVFIRFLGSQYFGLSNLFSDILTLLSFAELGIGSAITYSMYEPVSNGDNYKIAALINFYRKAYRIVATIVFFAGISVIPFLDKVIKNVPDIKENITFIYFLYIVNTASSYLLIYKSVIFEAKQKRSEILSIESIYTIIRLIIECVELIIFKEYLLYLVTDIIINILQNFTISQKANGEYEHIKDAKLEENEYKRIFHDIFALAMYQVAFVALASSDSIIISTVIGTEIVGFLGCYKMITNQLISFIQTFFYGAMASVGNLAATDNTEKQHELFNEINFTFYSIAYFCCVELFLILDNFVEFWAGNKYVLGQSVVIVLVIDFYLNVMRQIVSMFRTTNGLFVQGKYRPLFMAAINIILSIVLGIKWGVLGVLLATIISKLLTEVWYDPWIIYKNVYKKSTIEYYKQYLIYIISIVFVCAISFGICSLIHINNIIALIFVKAIIGFIVSFIIYFIMWRNTELYYKIKARAISVIHRK